MNGPTFRELLRGKGAHVDPVASVAHVPQEVAGRLLEGYPHSIWQILSHMNYWMNYEIQRIAGNWPEYPEHAIESWPEKTSPGTGEEWNKTRAQLAALIQKLNEISEAGPEVLQAQVAGINDEKASRPATVEAVLWQTVVHNSYHAGQIALMLRSFGLWPPPAGGDTW
jgi:uncharacterized damage-inducible protein DinB